MLSKDEVQAILTKFEDQKKAPAKKPKKGDAGADEGKIAARVSK